jgi:hypothetical protein
MEGMLTVDEWERKIRRVVMEGVGEGRESS